jgi:acyl-CoA thioesterase
MSTSEDTGSQFVAPTLEAIRQTISSFGYAQLLGMQIEALHNGTGAVRISVDERLMHPQKTVHGGLIFTLADTAMSMALISVLPPGTRFSTIEAKINFLLPVRTGELLAEAHIIHRGRSTAVLEATVHNINGEERQAIARVLGTFNIASSQLRHTIPTQEGAP